MPMISTLGERFFDIIVLTDEVGRLWQNHVTTSTLIVSVYNPSPVVLIKLLSYLGLELFET